jgi:hypothetical protein
VTGSNRRLACADSLLGESIIPYNTHENRLPKRTGRVQITVLPCGFPTRSARLLEFIRTGRFFPVSAVSKRVVREFAPSKT